MEKQNAIELNERDLRQVNGGSIKMGENGDAIKSCSANNHGVGGGNCPYSEAYCWDHDCRGCTRVKPWLQ